MAGVPFLFGHQGMEVKEVTTALVMATAAASTLCL